MDKKRIFLIIDGIVHRTYTTIDIDLSARLKDGIYGCSVSITYSITYRDKPSYECIAHAPIIDQLDKPFSVTIRNCLFQF